MKSIRNVNRLFLTFVLIYVLLYVVQTFMKIEIPLTVNASLLLSQAMVLVPTGVWLIAGKTKIAELVPFKKISISTVFMVILFTYLMMPLITVINAISMLYSTNLVSETTALMTGNPFWLNVLLMAVIPAISEEFVFRGIFYQTYRRKNVIQGAIGCGIVFGLMHMNFNQFSYALVLGLIFAFLIEATGSIFAPMIAHFIINNNSVVLMELLARMQKVDGFQTDAAGESAQMIQTVSDVPAQQMLYMIVMLMIAATFTTLMAVAVYLWITRKCGTSEHIREIFRPEVFRRSVESEPRTIFSVPFLIAAAISIMFMIMTEMM